MMLSFLEWSTGIPLIFTRMFDNQFQELVSRAFVPVELVNLFTLTPYRIFNVKETCVATLIGFFILQAVILSSDP